MNTVLTHAPSAKTGLLGLEGRSLPYRSLAVMAGTLFLAAASYIEVPMLPVPLTMQTYAVTLVGALYGWRLGAITVAIWLMEGAVGLPVLAGGASGFHHFYGPTGGYLFGFIAAAALVGWLYETGWNGKRMFLAFLAMLLGNAVCILLGAVWLGVQIGAEPALVHGVIPFVLGAVLKSALGAATLKVAVLRRKGLGEN